MNRVSDTVLITSYRYNAAGEVDTVTDPMGIKSKTFYDALGRTTDAVQAWNGSFDPTGGTLPSTGDANQTTKYTYDGAGHVLTLTAVMPAGQSSQTTQYVYAIAEAITAGAVSSPVVYSNDLLWLVKYPTTSGSSAGLPSSTRSGWNVFTYDALGETLTRTDQNLTVHTYTYDLLGRLAQDAVTFPQGNSQNIDTSVLLVITTYNTQGLVATIGGYHSDHFSSLDSLNYVTYTYNGLGQLTLEHQEHQDAGAGGGSSDILYTYSDPEQGSRLVAMTNPNGYDPVAEEVVNLWTTGYSYGASGSLNDVIGRLDAITDNGTASSQTLESYLYLGLSTVVERLQNPTGYKLTFVNQGDGGAGAASNGGDPYTGLDTFGRVVDQNWVDQRFLTNGTANGDRYTYTYDRDSNRITKNNVLLDNATVNAYDETYTYDALNRLTATNRAGSAYQGWDLDALGNMNSVTTTTGGTPVTENRTTNSANQITQINGQTLTYDANGNTTTDDLGHTLTYDAWNRLIQVDNGTNSMMTYAYDGLGRRISETPGGEDAVTTDLFYDNSWQVVEEDNIGDTGSLHARYVWSPVYVDAMVMRDYDFTGSYDFQLNERTFVLSDANYNVTALISRETVTGDANGDGFTDSLDDDIWFAHLGLSLAGGGIIGDFDHSGITDLVDFDLWFHHLGFEGGPQWTVTERFVYDAYGTSITTDGNWTVGSDYLAWNFTFQGGRQDRVTGLINFQMRDYNPRTYTWDTKDPLGFVDGLNLKQFVEGNPINKRDPQGTWTFVPNMGRLTGSLGPYPGGPLSKAAFSLTFWPDFDAFQNLAKCDEINFLQIYFYRTNYSTLTEKASEWMGGLTAGKWTLDIGSDDPPYYNDKAEAVNPAASILTMVDAPGQIASPWRLSNEWYDFETAVVVTKGPEKGDVLATIQWGFAFGIEGPLWNMHPVPMYNVGNNVGDAWGPKLPEKQLQNIVAGSPQLNATGIMTYDFSFSKGTNTPPSKEMANFLDQYFP